MLVSPGGGTRKQRTWGRDQPPASWGEGLDPHRSDQLSADTKELVLQAQLRSLAGERREYGSLFR